MELKFAANTNLHPVEVKKLKAIRFNALLEKTGLSKTHIYRLIEKGEFPKGTHISERVVIWEESAIDSWLKEKFIGAV
jgi:prophage regulatory protein